MEEKENINGGYYLLTHGLDEKDTFPGGVLPGCPFLSEGKWGKKKTSFSIIFPVFLAQN